MIDLELARQIVYYVVQDEKNLKENPTLLNLEKIGGNWRLAALEKAWNSIVLAPGTFDYVKNTVHPDYSPFIRTMSVEIFDCGSEPPWPRLVGRQENIESFLCKTISLDWPNLRALRIEPAWYIVDWDTIADVVIEKLPNLESLHICTDNKYSLEALNRISIERPNIKRFSVKNLNGVYDFASVVSQTTPALTSMIIEMKEPGNMEHISLIDCSLTWVSITSLLLKQSRLTTVIIEKATINKFIYGPIKIPAFRKLTKLHIGAFFSRAPMDYDIPISADNFPNLRELVLKSETKESAFVSFIRNRINLLNTILSSPWLELDLLSLPTINDLWARAMPQAFPNIRVLDVDNGDFDHSLLTDFTFRTLTESMSKLVSLNIASENGRARFPFFRDSIVSKDTVTGNFKTKIVCDNLQYLSLRLARISCMILDRIIMALPNLETIVFSSLYINIDDDENVCTITPHKKLRKLVIDFYQRGLEFDILVEFIKKFPEMLLCVHGGSIPHQDHLNLQFTFPHVLFCTH